MQDLALNSEMFHVATLSEDDSDAAPLLPEASPRTQRKFDTVRQENVNFPTFFGLKNSNFVFHNCCSFLSTSSDNSDKRVGATVNLMRSVLYNLSELNKKLQKMSPKRL
jgi:hypothetical protein